MRLKKGTIFGLAGVLLVIFGIILYFVLEVKKEKDTNDEDANKVVDNYNIYKTFAEETSKWRSDNILTDRFIEEINDNYDEWIKTYDEYKNKIKEHDEKSKELKNLCINKTYASSDVTSKCDAFIIAYETMVNYYINDITDFNELLGQYRDSDTIIDKKDDIKDFDKGNYEYIDINDDGDYTGMKTNN